MAHASIGQISVEYMVIIGFVTVITIPLIIVYSTFTQDSADEINTAQAKQIAKKIVDAAESVYYLGEPSQTTLSVNVPDKLVLANFSSGKEVVFKVSTKSGKVDIVQNTRFNISGDFPTKAGSYTITIKAMPNYVNVSYK